MSDWKIFRFGSIRPSLETITRNGNELCPRATRAARNSGSGKPKRTLSCFKVLCPIRTASPRLRCRKRCFLSSGEVKSIGVKFFVVILPSTVTANVAATYGRCRRECGRTPPDLRNRDRVARGLFLFGFADLMLYRSHLTLHISE